MMFFPGCARSVDRWRTPRRIDTDMEEFTEKELKQIKRKNSKFHDAIFHKEIKTEFQRKNSKFHDAIFPKQKIKTEFCFKCKYCCDETLFETDLQLEKHENEMHLFKCDLCDRICGSNNLLNRHKQRLHNYECDFCPRQFTTGENLALHSSFAHCICQECNLDLVSIVSLQNHKQVKHGKKEASPIFKCDLCDEKCGSNISLKYHKQIIHSMQARKSETSPKVEQIKVKKEIKTEIDESVSVKIESCETKVKIEPYFDEADAMLESFQWETNLIVKNEETSTMIEQAKSEDSDMIQNVNNELSPKIQMEEFEIDNQNENKCEVKMDDPQEGSATAKHVEFEHQSNLALHVKSFGTKDELLLHQENNHWIKCNYCTDSFLTTEQLETHQMEKHRHKCDRCNKQFRTKGGLSIHKKMDHNFCAKCDVSFRTMRELNNHIKYGHHFKRTDSSKTSCLINGTNLLSNELLIHNRRSRLNKTTKRCSGCKTQN